MIVKAGSETRHRTIYGGMNEISSWTEKPSIVIVHDVVRPLIDEATCRLVVEAAAKYGVSCLQKSLRNSDAVTNFSDLNF